MVQEGRNNWHRDLTALFFTRHDYVILKNISVFGSLFVFYFIRLVFYAAKCTTFYKNVRFRA